MRTLAKNAKPTNPALKQSEKGFTLIELSIVLVIIGLIVGGILVGQDLIKAAEIRATLAQIEKYNTAVNTFRNKYNQIPGDFVAQQAASFSFAARGTNGSGGTAAGDGDGNGVIDNCALGGSVGLGCETSLFWDDLSKAGYIDTTTTLGDISPAKGNAAAVLAALPNAKLGKGNTISVYEVNSVNYWFIGVITQIGISVAGGNTVYPATSGAYTLPAAPQGGLSPNQAFSMDKKVDDGLPTTGIITMVASQAAFNPTTALTTSFTNCVQANNTYNTTTTASVADAPLCQMQYRFN